MNFVTRIGLLLISSLIALGSGYPRAAVSRIDRLREIHTVLSKWPLSQEAIQHKQRQQQQPSPSSTQLQQGHDTDFTLPADFVPFQSSPKTMPDRVPNGLLSGVMKRQQGWHTQYGKRQTPRFDLDVRNLDNVMLELSDSAKKERKRQQGWNTPYGKRQQEWQTTYGKRQQGWNTPYGKRQQEWHTMYDKRQQGLKIPYGKRQQGWETPYGKRGDAILTSDPVLREWKIAHEDRFTDSTDDVLQDREGWRANYANYDRDDFDINESQQSWNSAFRKRSMKSGDRLHKLLDTLAKRQQGWHVPYGKRQQGWHVPYGKRQQG